jgi:ATP-dependent Clp protease ATP-binding subunit ClpA
VSETLASGLRGRVLESGSAERRPRRRTRRLRAQLAAHEDELLRRQQTALSLATETRRMRAALASALDDRARLERELARLSAERTSEAAHARRLAEAVLGQQAALRELERAVAVALAGRV